MLPFVQVFLAALAATLVLARIAPHLGWTDAPEGPDAARKLQRRAVPAVGGAALLVALALAPEGAVRGTPFALWRDAPWGWITLSVALGLTLLFALGFLDDYVAGGLRPRTKLLGQLVGLLPLALTLGRENVGLGVLVLLGGLVALNALNAFDNADGALASLAALGFAFAQPVIAAACLGFLPANLDATRPGRRASGAPTAYLGDAGSHVLGFLVLVTPAAWGTLCLPALDLARLAIVRMRTGSRPWIGDRAHFAHRLLARGLSRPLVALAQVLVAAPACAGVAWSVERGGALPAASGLVVTAILFGIGLGWTRGVAQPGEPSPERAVLAREGGSSNNVALDSRRAHSASALRDDRATSLP